MTSLKIKNHFSSSVISDCNLNLFDIYINFKKKNVHNSFCIITKLNISFYIGNLYIINIDSFVLEFQKQYNDNCYIFDMKLFMTIYMLQDIT